MATPIFDSTTGHYYQGVNAQNLAWGTAQQLASKTTYRGLQGYLATVTSASENATVLASLPATSTSVSYFLGGSDQKNEGIWRWQDGPEKGNLITYSNWNAGEPNNGLGIPQNSLAMYASTGDKKFNGLWDDTWSSLAAGVPGTASGYAVEFGGLPVSFQIETNESTINEGEKAIFTIHSLNLEWGSKFSYSISGITADDLVGGQLSGSLEVLPDPSGGIATLTLSLKNDRITEGKEFINLQVGSSQAQIVVNDTSRKPTYTFLNGTKSINEGESAVFLLQTTDVPVGTELSYTIEGVQTNDVVGGLSGKTVVVANGQAVIAIPTVVDLIAESSIVSTGKDSAGLSLLKTLPGVETLSVRVNDAISSVLVKDWTTIPTYEITPLSGSVDEGAEARFLINTTGLMPGSGVRYEISGDKIDLNDVRTDWGGLWGVALINGSVTKGQTIISIPVLADRKTEGGERMQVTIGSASAYVNINDTSKTPYYAVKALQESVREGKNLTFLITSSDEPGSVIHYQISGTISADDIDFPMIGSVTLNKQSSAILSIPTKIDTLKESSESVTIELIGLQAKASAILLDNT